MDHKFTYSEGSWYGTYDNGEKYKMETTSIPEGCRNDNFKVNSIGIVNQGLLHFPKGLGDFFPRLKILRIINCRLESISRKDLAGLQYLEELDLTGNRLKSLPDDLFKRMGKLKKISFTSNLLEELSPKLLMPIMKDGLIMAAFRDNRKIDDYYNSNPRHTAMTRRTEFMKRVEKNYQLSRKVPLSLKVEPFKNDFFARLAELRASGRMTDFTIVIAGPKELRVHKTILAVQSSVFAAMFESGMSEPTTGKMTITDFSAEAVEQFIDILYTEKITNVANAMELFGLAAKYDVPKFKAACKQIVMMNIDKTNAFEVLALGHLHSDLEMQHKARNVIKQTIPDFELDESLMDDPQRVDKLLKAVDKRNKRMQETELAADEIVMLCKKSKKSS